MKMSNVSSYMFLDGQISQAIVNIDQKTSSDLRSIIKTFNSTLLPQMGYDPVSPEDEEKLAREFEERNGVSMGLGAVVKGDGFEPWLDAA